MCGAPVSRALPDSQRGAPQPRTGASACASRGRQTHLTSVAPAGCTSPPLTPAGGAGAPSLLMTRALLLLLLILAMQALNVTTADAAATAATHAPPGNAASVQGFWKWCCFVVSGCAGDTLTSMCGHGQRQSSAAEAEGQSSRRVRCAPREELPPELKHQYTLDQVVGIVQDIKHRLGHLQFPNVDKQRKSKGRRRPPKQPKRIKRVT